MQSRRDRMFHAASGTGQYRAVLSMTGCSLTGPLLPAAGVLQGWVRSGTHQGHSTADRNTWTLPDGARAHIDTFQIGSDQLRQTFFSLTNTIQFLKKQKFDFHRFLPVVSSGFPSMRCHFLPIWKPGRVQPTLEEQELSGSCMAAQSSQVCFQN